MTLVFRLLVGYGAVSLAATVVYVGLMWTRANRLRQVPRSGAVAYMDGWKATLMDLDSRVDDVRAAIRESTAAVIGGEPLIWHEWSIWDEDERNRGSEK